jgi:hypothetical protein
VIVIRFSFDFGIKRLEMGEAVFTDITHHFQAAIGERSEIANQIGPPITTAHHSDFYLFCHTINSISMFFSFKYLRHLQPDPHPAAVRRLMGYRH